MTVIDKTLPSTADLRGLLGPRWVEIETETLRHNVLQVLSLLRPPCRLLAVMKADAYGFGAVEASKVALDNGAAMLGVTLVEEALELRASGIRAPILVFAPPLPEEARRVVASGLTATITDLETGRCLAKMAREMGQRAKVHLKVDTGLGRLGVRLDQVRFLMEELCSYPELELEGVYTHAASRKSLRNQAQAFASVCRMVDEGGWGIKLKHFCSSFGTVSFPQLHWDMVRVGTLLYGQWPEGCPRFLDIKDPWLVKARLLHVREMEPGSRVGYGRGFRLKQRRILGVIGLGYNDGLSMAPMRPPEGLLETAKGIGKLLISLGRGYPGWGTVTLNGMRLPLVGRLSMQLAVVDITGAGPVTRGQEVTIHGLRRTAASARLPRLYLSGGQAYRLRLLEGWVDLAGSEKTYG